jgi:hypothetical protein
MHNMHNYNQQIHHLNLSNHWLDRQSRFLLELLQTMYQVGLTKINDRVTTERCNGMIHRLSTMVGTNRGILVNQQQQQPDPDNNDDMNHLDDCSGDWAEELTNDNHHNQNHDNKIISTDHDTTLLHPLSTEYWLRTQRATAILESMELFQTLRKQHPHHRFPVPLPLPNHDTYFQVLKMYASSHLQQAPPTTQPQPPSTQPTLSTTTITMAQNEAPIRARQIVQRMAELNDLAMKPSSMHWNQVLCAYAHSSRPQRALEAATLLYELDAQQHLTDESSFSQTLRCCVDTVTNYLHQPPSQSQQQRQQQHRKFAEIAVAVAPRVWKGLHQRHQQSIVTPTNTTTTTTTPNSNTISMIHTQHHAQDPLSEFLGTMSTSNQQPQQQHKHQQQHPIQLQSHHFVHMMRVARNFIVLQDPQRQFEWIQTIFAECCQAQKVNSHVLYELIHQAKLLSQAQQQSQHSQDDHNNHHNNDLQWIEQIIVPLMMKDNHTTTAKSNLQLWMQRMEQKRPLSPSRSSTRLAKSLLRQLPTAWTGPVELTH